MKFVFITWEMWGRGEYKYLNKTLQTVCWHKVSSCKEIIPESVFGWYKTINFSEGDIFILPFVLFFIFV